MTGRVISGGIVFDISDVDRGFASVKRAAHNLRPVFKEWRPIFKAHLAQHFVEQRAAEGAWPAPAQSSVDRVMRQRGTLSARGRRGALLPGGLTKRGVGRMRRLHEQLGRLKTAIGFRINARYIEAFSFVKWAGIHQDGGVGGRGSRIPMREFLWVSDAALAILIDKIRAALARAF